MYLLSYLRMHLFCRIDLAFLMKSLVHVHSPESKNNMFRTRHTFDRPYLIVVTVTSVVKPCDLVLRIRQLVWSHIHWEHLALCRYTFQPSLLSKVHLYPWQRVIWKSVPTFRNPGSKPRCPRRILGIVGTGCDRLVFNFAALHSKCITPAAHLC